MDYAEEKMAGIQRLVQVRAQIDERASLILTFHAALEREMDLKLSRILPRAHKLRGLGFGQKVSVLDAAWPSRPEGAEKLCGALSQFNDLRNSIAHGDSKKQVDRIVAKIKHTLEGDLPDNDPRDVVASISAFLLGMISGPP